MAIYVYTNSPGEEGQPLIPGDYTLLRGPCDEGFHVPLIEERQAIIDAGLTFSQTQVNLHIPITGSRSRSDGSWEVLGYGYLWSSSPNGDNIKHFYIHRSDSRIGISLNVYRASCESIRAFRNTPIIPDSSWTETVTGKVWYNSDLGLISILVGNNQYITMQDKNVGATVVWNDGDTLTNDNRGKYFQRGNNYGFTWGSSGDTSSTRVDASGYGPNNPYSSNRFILKDGDRSTVKNDNLRGYTDFNS